MTASKILYNRVRKRKIMASDKPSLMLPSESPLLKAETELYVKNQTQADFNRNISGYMFWGATSILGALAIGIFSSGLASIGVPLIAAAVAASAATFFGSVYFSNKATEISERSNVLYSDIDSHNKARRMVQTFARAQTASAAATPVVAASSDTPYMDTNHTNWVERAGAGQQAQMESWQSRIAAEADIEDQRTLQELNSR